MWIEMQDGEYAWCDGVTFEIANNGVVLGAKLRLGQYRTTMIRGDRADELYHRVSTKALRKEVAIGKK